MYRIISSTNRDFDFFLSYFPYFIVLTKTLNIILNKSGGNEHLYLVPYFSENTLTFSFNLTLAIRLSYTAFIMLKHMPFSPNLFRIFNVKEY